MKRLWILLPILTVLQGCAGAVIGAGAAVGNAALEERGLNGVAEDTAIQLKINELWFNQDVEMYRKVDITVREGRVLLTGNVEKPEMRVEAVRLAWQVEGVREVINEIVVKDDTTLVDMGRDAWIATQLRGEIIFDENVDSVNYTVDVVNGSVYLMGIARDNGELNRVVNHARNLAYVKRIVNLVRVKES